MAFATLNLITYGLWWSKPLSVQCPYRVVKNRQPVDGDRDEMAAIIHDVETTTGVANEEGGEGLTLSWQYDRVPRQRSIILMTELLDENGNGATFEEMPLVLTLRPFLIMAGLKDNIKEKKVATFYAGVGVHDDKFKPYLIVASGITALFRAIHCIAWSFKFPSHAEKVIWVTCSLMITFIPLFIPITLALTRLHGWLFHHIRSVAGRMVVEAILSPWFHILSFWVSIWYTAARLILLILVLISFRALNAEVYQTVHWTTFIPHV